MKHKSRFQDPGHGYRAHTQTYKSKHKYDREKDKIRVERDAKKEEE